MLNARALFRGTGVFNRRHLWALPLVALWFTLFWKASFFWGSEGYYFLGWLVPFLTVFFLGSRLRDAPVPVAAPRFAALACVLASLGALLALFLGESMPFWRPLLYLQAACTVLASLCFFYWMGGIAWVRHFLPLSLFVLVGLPWAESIENPAIYRLTLIIADLTETSLNLIGFGAEAIGNRIFVQGKVVEVGDACSGIRSFQGLFMIGLVVGELYRLGWHRLTLALTAFLISFPLNVLRAQALSVIVVESGWEAYHRWHDPLGGIVYAVGCSVLLGIAAILPQRTHRESAATRVRLKDQPFFRPSSFGTIGLTSLITIVFLFIQGWYLSHSQAPATALAWQLETPPQSSWNAQSILMDPSVYDLLNYDAGAHREVLSPEGRRFELFDFLYASGTKGLLATEYHRPDICMAKYSDGVVFQQSDAFPFTVGPRSIHVGGYHIVYPDGRAIFAFQGVWIAGRSPDGVQRYKQMVLSAHNRIDRLETAFRRAMAGRRDFPIQVFLVATDQAKDLEHAWSLCGPVLESFLKPAPTIDSGQTGGN